MKNLSVKVLSKNFLYYFPADIQNTFHAFETSWETDNLQSEDNRNIYCELIDWKRNPNWKNANQSIVPSGNITADNAKVDDYGEDDGINKNIVAINDNQINWWTEIELTGGNFVDSLSIQALTKIAKAFREGDIDERIYCHDRILFGNLIDLDILLTFLFQLENQTYFKRVVESKIKDDIRIHKLKNDRKTNWKKIAIELFFTEFVECLKYSDVKSDKIRPQIDTFVEKCADYINNLTIKKVNPQKWKIFNPYTKDIVTRNYTNEECRQTSFEFFKPLKNLHNLHITFDPQVNHDQYERRYYQISIEDIANLSKSLETLDYLETLEITKTNLENDAKISHLLTSIEQLRFLRILTLTHCNISSRLSGVAFRKFFSHNHRLRVLNLRNNDLDLEFCREFAVGIEKFRGYLRLILAMNGILHYGLSYILKSAAKSDNLTGLDMSSCDGFKCEVFGTAFKELNKYVATTQNLKELDISNDMITDKLQRKNFVRAMEKNYSILSCGFLNCNFSTKQEVDIGLQVLKNNHYDRNPILKKESFSREDEVEAEKWLRRVKHPLLVKVKSFMPANHSVAWENRTNASICLSPIRDYEDFTYFYTGKN